MRTHRLFWPVALTMGLLGTAGLETRAQDPGNPTVPAVPSDRLTVRAHARAVAPADDLELEIVVEASSEDAQDAEKKHRQKLNRVVAALTGKEPAPKAKVKSDDDDEDDSTAKRKPKKSSKKSDDDEAPTKKSNADDADSKSLPTVGVADADGMVFDVREGRSTVGIQGSTEATQDDGQNNGEKRPEGEIRVGTAVHVVFKNIAKVSPHRLHKLVAATIDKASEAGADMGGSKTNVKPAIRFRIHDCESLKRKAYAEALTKGRARAEELARLSNRGLGKITCVTEIEPTAAPANQVPEGWAGFVAQLGTNDPGNDDGVSSSSEVTVDIALQLEFDLK